MCIAATSKCIAATQRSQECRVRGSDYRIIGDARLGSNGGLCACLFVPMIVALVLVQEKPFSCALRTRRMMRPRGQRFKTRTRHTALSRHSLDSPKAAETTLPICTSHDLKILVASPPPDLQRFNPSVFAFVGLCRECFHLFVCYLVGC